MLLQTHCHVAVQPCRVSGARTAASAAHTTRSTCGTRAPPTASEEGSRQERYRLSTLSTEALRELISVMSPERVTAALEGELWQGRHLELQPLPASLRRKLGASCAARSGRLQAVAGW